MPLVTLTTDFGTEDGYVGAMKGVLARLAPDVTVVDIAHHIPRHDVAHAAWVLATATAEFPAGTIHVAVVDPGVGGSRQEVVVQAGGQIYVGPDNGLFAYVAVRAESAYSIQSSAFRLPDVSPTFHGRDVFAAAAAALARGLPPAVAGPVAALKGRLPWSAEASGGRGVVVHVDHYGNLISNVRMAHSSHVQIAGRDITVRRIYEDVPDGALIAHIGSAGTLEVAVRNGDAARMLGATRGDVFDAR